MESTEPKRAFERIAYNQSERTATYCDRATHVSVVNPLHTYSGDPHEIALSPCDCAREEVKIAAPVVEEEVHVDEVHDEPLSDLQNAHIEGDSP